MKVCSLHIADNRWQMCVNGTRAQSIKIIQNDVCLYRKEADWDILNKPGYVNVVRDWLEISCGIFSIVKNCSIQFLLIKMLLMYIRCTLVSMSSNNSEIIDLFHQLLWMTCFSFPANDFQSPAVKIPPNDSPSVVQTIIFPSAFHVRN